MNAPAAMPDVERPPGELRRRLYTLRRGLGSLQRDRVRACGFCRTGQEVQLVIDAHGQAQFRGTQHCSCVWECPVCQMLIKVSRRDEVETAVAEWGAERCVMLTLTIRHGSGDNLRHMRQNLQRAYAAMTRGAPWQRFMQRTGLEESIRSLELTYGARNGWHPHLHIVWFLRDNVRKSDVFDLGDEGARWLMRERDDLRWLQERWRTVVERFMGAEHVPDYQHGLTLSPLSYSDPETGELHSGAKYIQKLGLEVLDPGNKTGRKRGQRTPLQIAFDYTRTRDRRDAALWRVYCRSMRGAKQLTWSSGFKRRMKIHCMSDAEIVTEHEEGQPTDRRLGVFAGPVWELLRVRYVDGVPGPYHVLHRVTEGGPEAAAQAVQEVAESTDVRAQTDRTKGVGLLEWKPDWGELPPDRSGPVRQRICPGCGTTSETARDGCRYHELCTPFTKSERHYNRRANVISAMQGDRRCPSCKLWQDVQPSRLCADENHRAQHELELAV